MKSLRKSGALPKLATGALKVSWLFTGTTNGTTSDIDGNYALSLSKETTLVFPYICYTSDGGTIDYKQDADRLSLNLSGNRIETPDLVIKLVIDQKMK
jgi:hypothetical protein